MNGWHMAPFSKRRYTGKSLIPKGGTYNVIILLVCRLLARPGAL